MLTHPNLSYFIHKSREKLSKFSIANQQLILNYLCVPYRQNAFANILHSLKSHSKIFRYYINISVRMVRVRNDFAMFKITIQGLRS